MIRIGTRWLVALAALLPVTAAAAEGEEAPPEPTEAAPEPAAEAEAASDAPVNIMAGYPDWMGPSGFPRIADTEETIYSVQRKAYLVDKAFELTPMAAATFTDRFVQSFAPALSVTFHLAENFGLEAFGTYVFPFESGLTTEILNKGKLTPEIAKLTQMLWAAGLGAQWSPIYGKLEVFGASLGTFSFYVGVGAGIGQTRVQCTPALAIDPEQFGEGAKCDPLTQTNDDGAFEVIYEPSRMQFMAALSGGIRFYFSDAIGLKLEVKDWLFPARVFRPGSQEPTQRYTDAIRNNLFIQLGVSFLFGGESN